MNDLNKTSEMGDAHGRNVSEVLEILEQKRAGHVVKDRIGLVVQGGGMRGVYSIGALAALEEMGFGQCFDHITGSSAGAMNGAYFITGQANYAVHTYVNHLTQKAFVNPFRFNKMVDIDFLVDHIGKKERPLDIKKLEAANTMLHISLTEYLSGETHFVTNKTPGIDLWEALRASAAMLFLYNKPVRVGERLYVDGSLRARLPIKRAIDCGCTYIVIILTMPRSYRVKGQNALIKSLTWPVTRHYGDAVREALLGEDEDFNNIMSDLSRRNPQISGYSNRLVLITPEDLPERFSTITTDPKRLMRSALGARADTWRAFGKTPPPLDDPFPEQS